jgi:hypothetical protein
MSDKRRLFGQMHGGRLNSERLSLRVTARNRIRIDHQQIREEVVTLSKIPLLLKEARRQRELVALGDMSNYQ